VKSIFIDVLCVIRKYIFNIKEDYIVKRLKVRNNIYLDICQKLLGKGIQIGKSGWDSMRNKQYRENSDESWASS